MKEVRHLFVGSNIIFLHWVIDCCLTPSSCREQVRWDDDNIYVVLYQDAHLDFNSARLLKKQSADRHVAVLKTRHSDSDSTLPCSYFECLVEKQQILILQSLVWSYWYLNWLSTAFEASTLHRQWSLFISR